MKKINLKEYEIEVKLSNGESKKIPYNVRETLVSLLFHPDMKLGGRDLLIAQKLATKIEDCKEDEILLEAVDFEKLSRAFDTFKGFGRNEVELVKRILEAPDVEVTEKK